MNFIQVMAWSIMTRYEKIGDSSLQRQLIFLLGHSGKCLSLWYDH